MKRNRWLQKSLDKLHKLFAFLLELVDYIVTNRFSSLLIASIVGAIAGGVVGVSYSMCEFTAPRIGAGPTVGITGITGTHLWFIGCLLSETMGSIAVVAIAFPIVLGLFVIMIGIPIGLTRRKITSQADEPKLELHTQATVPEVASIKKT